jgi:hypothetical protein
MSLYSDRLLEGYVANVIRTEGRAAAVRMCADWHDVMDEMAAGGVNTAPLWSELTTAMIRLNMVVEVEAARLEPASETAAVDR